MTSLMSHTFRFRRNGGQLVTGRINSFSEVSDFGKFDLVMNCTGLGAKTLCNDRRLVPLRGQVFKVINRARLTSSVSLPKKINFVKYFCYSLHHNFFIGGCTVVR